MCYICLSYWLNKDCYIAQELGEGSVVMWSSTVLMFFLICSFLQPVNPPVSV